MDLGQIIAANLRKLRIERDISSSQLAKASGVSKAMLSEIERGNGNPTVNTLLKIANGLNVPYMRLMEEQEEEVELVRREEADGAGAVILEPVDELEMLVDKEMWPMPSYGDLIFEV